MSKEKQRVAFVFCEPFQCKDEKYDVIVSLSSKETNKSMIKMFDVFKDKVKISKNAFYDYNGYIENLLKGFSIVDYAFNDDNDNIIIVFKNKEGNVVEVPINFIPVFTEEAPTICLKNIMTKIYYVKDEFYDEFMRGYDGKISKVSYEDSKNFITSKEDFEKLKTYIDDDKPLDIDFKEGEHVITFV